MKAILARLAEPSSHAGLGLILVGILVALGIVPTEATTMPGLAQYGGGGGAIAAGIIAFFRKEGGTP